MAGVRRIHTASSTHGPEPASTSCIAITGSTRTVGVPDAAQTAHHSAAAARTSTPGDADTESGRDAPESRRSRESPRRRRLPTPSSSPSETISRRKLGQALVEQSHAKADDQPPDIRRKSRGIRSELLGRHPHALLGAAGKDGRMRITIAMDSPSRLSSRTVSRTPAGTRRTPESTTPAFQQIRRGGRVEGAEDPVLLAGGDAHPRRHGYTGAGIGAHVPAAGYDLDGGTRCRNTVPSWTSTHAPARPQSTREGRTRRATRPPMENRDQCYRIANS